MTLPILLPDLGADDQTIRVSTWLVDVGNSVEAEERLVEVVVPGITFDVPAPCAGILSSIEAHNGAIVTTGATLGMIEPT